MSVQNLRLHERLSKAESVQLLSLGQADVSEMTTTQNISSHGARVLTNQVWTPGSRLLVRSIKSDFAASAQVIYWDEVAHRKAIGLRFELVKGSWEGTTA